MSTPDRTRIASLLLAPRDKEGVVRSPLSAEQTVAAIRALPALERARLTSHIDWVQDYEAHDNEVDGQPI